LARGAVAIGLVLAAGKAAAWIIDAARRPVR